MEQKERKMANRYKGMGIPTGARKTSALCEKSKLQMW
jgi:hypothetical protein